MIHTVPETGSTNSDLAARLAGGDYVPEGDWFLADRQTAGRGRLGRVWNDGSGNFMGSTLVRPGPGDPPPASLALLTGLAVYEALIPFIAMPGVLRLKWPNDVLLGNAKLAGILLEMARGCVIVGIGVNLAQAPDVPGREVAALSQFGPAPDRDAFALGLAASFARELERWRSAGLAPLLRRWQSAAHPEGTRLSVHPPGEEAIKGAFAGLTGDGALRLRLPDGELRVIHAGDVLIAGGPAQAGPSE